MSDNAFLTPETWSLPYHSQEMSNLCWAFAALTCFELKLLKKYPKLPGKQLWFSRTHMRYSCYDNFPEKKQQTYGATLSSGYPGSDRPTTINLVKAYFSRGSGPVNDFMEPFQSGTTVDSRTFDEIETKMTRAWQVSNFVEIIWTEARDKQIADIKAAVKEHGAVAASICYDQDYLTGGGNYYFYCNASGDSQIDSPNHALVIVGWDDTVAASNFKVKGKMPSSPGAFLVRDSSISHPVTRKGPGSSSEERNNYYYVSYEDKYIVGRNYYIEDVRPWYTAMKCYQHNYYGAMFDKERPRNFANQKSVSKVFYTRSGGAEEKVDSILLFNACTDTTLSAYIGLPSGDGGYEERLILPEKTAKTVGYQIFEAESGPDNQPVTIPADVEKFYLKIVYSRFTALMIPLESNGKQRRNFKFRGKIPKIPAGEEFLLSQTTGGTDYDLSDSANEDVNGRLTCKLFTRPGSDKWNSFCDFVDQYEVPAALNSQPGNLAVPAPNKVVWEIKKLNQKTSIENLKLSECTLLNVSKNDIEVGLHAIFENDGNKIDRFYYTTVKPAGITLNAPVPPKKGESAFRVSGSSSYAGAEVRIMLYEGAEGGTEELRAMLCADKDGGEEIGKGTTDAQGQFNVQCEYMGYGKFTLQAMIDGMMSNECTIEIEKSYEEKDDPDKPKTKHITPHGSNGLDQALKRAMECALLGFTCYLLSKYRIPAPRRAGYELFNVIWRTPPIPVDLADGAQADAPGIYLPEDLPEDYVFIKSMTNSSIQELTFTAGPNVTLIDRMDNNSSLKNCTIKRTLKTGRGYIPVIQHLDGGSVSNCSLDIQGDAVSLPGSFSGLVGQLSGGTIDTLHISLPKSLAVAETFSGAAAEVSGGAKILDCSVSASSVKANNGAGVSFTATNAVFEKCSFEGDMEVTDRGAGVVFEIRDNSTIRQCRVKGTIKGRAIGGIAGCAIGGLRIEQCLATGTIQGQDISAGILGSVRLTGEQKDFVIENSLSAMDCESQDGYVGGIAGMCGGPGGVKISNCLAAGNIRCLGQGAQCGQNIAGGIAAQAQSVSSCALLTNQIDASMALLSAGGAENCLCWDDINLVTEGGASTGWNAIDSQCLYKQAGWAALSWDFTDIWTYTADSYPFLRAFEQQAEPFYPFLYITPNQQDGTCRFKTGDTITLQGVYSAGVTDIKFLGCRLLEKTDNLKCADGREGILLQKQQAENGAWSFAFGTLMVEGAFEFLVGYKQRGTDHKARIIVNVVNS